MLQREIVSDVGRQHRRRGRGWRIARRRFARGVAPLLVIPGGPVVTPGGFVESGIQAVVRELEAFLYQERRIGVIDQVIFGDAVILERVTDETAEEGEVGAGANL